MVLKQNIKKHLTFLLKSQWWSKGELENYQNERLRLLIIQAYYNVPYYNEVMRERKLKPYDIKTINDLYKLPVLTKEVFKQNYPGKLLATNWKESKILNRSSSGSTGTPIQYMMTRDGYGFNKACHLRGWYWMGYRLGDKMVKISQNKRKTFEKKMQDLLDRTYLFAQEYTSENFNYFYDEIMRIKPQFLRSYPDPLQFISSQLKKEGKKIAGLKAINTTGNILFPEVRELIEDCFETKIFDTYSCEGGPNFFECHTHECYHSSMEYGIAEILDENLKPVEAGENGRLYTTDLWNFTSPFIRYDSKDIVTKAKNPCSCGRHLLNITKVIGRDNDIIISPNGKYLIAQTFTTFFKYIPSVIQFQIYQHTLNQVEIRLKVNQDYSAKIEKYIHDYWQEYMGKKMNIEIKVMDEIPLAPSGKRRFLMRNSNIPFLI